MWTVLAGMFLRRASRNRMDCDRNEGRFAESVLRLSGQGVDDWPDGEELTVPCSETCCNLLRRGGTAQIQGAITDMVAQLVRGKSLECARFRGFIVVAVDGVEQEVTRRTGRADETETRFQLEAKVVAPNGLALSLMTERVKPHATENGKRDCEIKAFRRLAARLKRAFPRLPVCIVGDALYACSPVMRICRANGWKFVLTFREGRSPDAYEMACDSMEVSKGCCGPLVARGVNQCKIEAGVVAWTGGVKFTTQSEGEEFNVVACEETKGGAYRGMFATNYDVDCADVASEVVGLRARARVLQPLAVQQELLPAHAAREQPLADVQRLRRPEAGRGLQENGPVRVGGAPFQGLPRNRHHGRIRLDAPQVRAAHEHLTRQDGHVLLNAVPACLRLCGGKGAACLESRLLRGNGMKTRSQMMRQARRSRGGHIIWNP